MGNKDTQLFGLPVVKSPNIRLEKLFGWVVIVVFFGGFGLWAYFAPLESAAIVPGKIAVAGHRRTVQHLEGGVVDKINVKDGSRVKKGEVLVEMDNTKAKAELQITHNVYVSLLAAEARLSAELKDEKTVRFSQTLLQYKEDPKTLQIMESQRAIFGANQRAYDGKVKIYNQQIDQLEEQIKGLNAQLHASKDQLILIKKELKDVKILASKGLIERSRLLTLQREQASLTGKEGEHVASISSLKQKIGETQLQMNSFKENYRKELLTELRDTQQKLSNAVEKRKAAMDVLERAEIRSPIDGIVVGLKVHTIGGVIKPGEAIMDIVPQHEQLIVEARVSPMDIDVVQPGLQAKIQLTALPSRTTPTLIGKVTHVSADAFQDEKTGNAYYLTQITIPEAELKKLSGQPLYPGMPAEVMIITSKLTPWQYFINPIKKSFGRAFREQ